MAPLKTSTFCSVLNRQECVNMYSLLPKLSQRESASTGWRASWLRVGHALPSTAHTLMQLQIETFISFYPTHFSIVELSKERTCS